MREQHGKMSESERSVSMKRQSQREGDKVVDGVLLKTKEHIKVRGVYSEKELMSERGWHPMRNPSIPHNIHTHRARMHKYTYVCMNT